ncbi:MAG: DUF885 domain-containing protein [Vicinamibacteria bacterium]
MKARSVVVRTYFASFLLLVAASIVFPQEARETSEELHRLFDEAWAFRLKEDPLAATAVGVHGYDDRLPSVTPEDLRRRDDANRDFLRRLLVIDRAKLGSGDRISYEMLERQLRDEIEDYALKGYLIPLTAEWGFHMAFARLPFEVPLEAAQDYENYIARLRAFPAYVDQYIGLLRQGIETGMTLPQVVLEGYEDTIGAHIVEEPTESVFYTPFVNFPVGVPEEDRAALRERGIATIEESAVAGYRSFFAFMVDEYIPSARNTIGASELPDGRAYYDHLIRHFTTLDITAEEIHRLGLAEVERIRSEMKDVIEALGFEGGYAEFLEFLRTDPRFYASTPEALLQQAAYIAKKADGKLPSLFKTLPRLPYGVEPVPDDIAPRYTGGRYIPAPIGSTRPGYYWVNTSALDSRPLYVLTSLTLHEAVPGHHLQTALTQELEDLPAFRRAAYIDAFGEGWGLYAEWLGLEAGMYEDPYSNFGRLTYEMWRACRLVVDTGLHAFGWTRQQAMDYLASNTALSLHEVRTEADRYISWPGQALAYKMGELKIKELRRRAEDALGARFDVREFHDVILAHGTVPLDVLERQVDDSIDAKLNAMPWAPDVRRR